MRFLGNKESMTDEIIDLLCQKELAGKGLVFFDAFCGTGSVADAMKGEFDLIVNDLLRWCVVYTTGRLVGNQCDFSGLGFNPFEYLNGNNRVQQGFMYQNYAPTASQRMYFTPENAGRIDYFRGQIQAWRDNESITADEYAYLLACLIESVSDVSNTAGVYGAYLKKWDSRALKPIVFNRVTIGSGTGGPVQSLNGRLEEIIEQVDCDVLYLDPPYTQNQYGTQYHLLETLVLDDNPSISAVTGSRSTAPLRSDWSKQYKAQINFDRVIAKTKAKHIIVSYNNAGLMSKDYIEASLKRYGNAESYSCKKIPYKKYQNWKSKNKNDNFEYLFYIEKKPEDEIVYESPLNYTGSKSKLIAPMKLLMPKNIESFYDLFGGGFNVGINIKAEQVFYNDINFFVKDLVESFRHYDTYEYLLYIRRMTKKFGLEKAKADSYKKAREHYNNTPINKRDPRLLYTVILYGYQQQIRFNGDHDFNNPVGMRWFNDRVLEKMISFSRVMKEGPYHFNTGDFTSYFNRIDPCDFVYMDPPYRLTTGAYNDGKRGFNGWGLEHEEQLLAFAARLNEKGVPFMISYVLEHGDKVNDHLKSWIEAGGFRLIEMEKVAGRNRKEVLIVNYGQ